MGLPARCVMAWGLAGATEPADRARQLGLNPQNSFTHTQPHYSKHSPRRVRAQQRASVEASDEPRAPARKYIQSIGTELARGADQGGCRIDASQRVRGILCGGVGMGRCDPIELLVSAGRWMPVRSGAAAAGGVGIRPLARAYVCTCIMVG